MNGWAHGARFASPASVARVKWWPAALLGVALGAAGCADESAAPPATTTPNTGPAEELAPSQRALPTLPPPTLPERCPPGTIEFAAIPGQPPDADIVVTFRNVGAAECEVDLDLDWATEHQIEPSVRLAPGATAELWGVAADPCDGGARPAWQLTVNGVEQRVALPQPSCPLAPVAFFPA